MKMAISKTCETCRYDADSHGPGGDCRACEKHDQWREPKRIDAEKCGMCKYENDPCHYLCVECQDAVNWEPKPTLKQILKTKIEFYKSEIERLEQLLDKCG